MEPQRVCSKCGIYETDVWSPTWWKCCPDHTPQHGPIFVCEFCAAELHPIHFNPQPMVSTSSWDGKERCLVTIFL